MGRLQKLTDLTASSDIIANATYAPTGQLLTMTGASGAPNETRTYNSIGQMTRLQSGSLDIQYAYPATQNNGKISSQYDSVSGEQITYMYDSLNRLASATGSGWGQSYNYDGFGNLTDQNVTSGTAPALHVTYDPGTNRQTGECADANGNLCGSYYSYDVENRFVRKGASFSVTPDVAYSYRPGNKRVWKGTNYVYNGQTNWSLPSTEEVTFWSITGQKLVAYNVTQYQPGGANTLPQLVAAQTGTNYYFGGKLVKNATGYVTPDRLGSIGKYFPYGQERPSATTDGKEKFATYFRDSETGLDYANARYHQPGMGRFMTPDPYMASGGPSDPGSWNRYAYVGGDPVNYNDSAGLLRENPSPPIQSPVELPGTHHTPGGNGDPQCMILYLAGQAGNAEAEQMFEHYCADVQVGGGGGQPNQPPAKQNGDLLLSIQSMLDNALSHSDCASIFGAAPILRRNPFSSPSAAQILDSLIQGNSPYGSIVFTQDALTGGADAVTIKNSPFLNFFGFATTSTVKIYSGTDLSGTAFNTSTYNAAETILHELGHVLFNRGWSTAIQPDGPLTSAANTNIVNNACGKYLQ